MKFSEEQVKEIVALRENLMKQVDKHQEGIEMLEKNITVLDGFLKDSSFVKASKLDTKIEPKKEEEISKPVQNSIPIKRGNDGKIIANAYVTPEQVSIILDEQISTSYTGWWGIDRNMSSSNVSDHFPVWVEFLRPSYALN